MNELSKQAPICGRLILALATAFMLFGALSSEAHESPLGCTGSALGINLFTDVGDVHIGDTIRYSATVFNGLPGSPRTACDATEILAGIVTPDGKTNMMTLRRTSLVNAENDFYTNVVSYVVRAQDLQPDGTVRATAFDNGNIHQNDTDSRGGGNQGVNTEVDLPCIQVTAQCVGSVGENGAIAFTGTVKNCGNTPLIGVTVSNAVNNSSFLVIGPINLATNQVVTFSGTYIPANPCAPSIATLVAQGTDTTTSFPRTVVAIPATTTCSEVLTPSILVTKVCPVAPVAPGQPLVFSGTVSNNGNATLTNIVVVNDQPAANTVIFTLPSLAPGASANFTGSYPAPVDCSSTSTVTAHANSVCGVAVSSTASSTCPIVTTPKILVTAVCATATVISGGVVSYTGTVKNIGDIPLSNILVISDRPAPNTTVFTIATLAPGASANFIASCSVPVGACSVTTTITGTGKDSCSGTTVASTVLATCSVATAPRIAVTLHCPIRQVAPGGLLTYGGTVSNPGDVTLSNVVVIDSQASPSTVFTVASMAPGASANFTATVTAPLDACSVTSTVSATGVNVCSLLPVTDTASATCGLTTAPALTITQNCPASPVSPGSLLSYTGVIRNTGNITLTNVVVLNDRSGSTPVFTAASLAPGVSTNFIGSYSVSAAGDCAVTSIVTVTANDKCTGAKLSAVAASTCPLLTTPQIQVIQVCPATPPLAGALLTYSGTVKNTGNIILTNVVVFNSRSGSAAILAATVLAPGATASFTGSYLVPLNCCSVSSTVTATGKDLCTLTAVTDTDTTTCPVLTLPKIVLTKVCPPRALQTGDLLRYSGTVSNAGNISLINVTVLNGRSATAVLGPITLAPGESVNYTDSYIVTADSCGNDTVTARGLDFCTSAPVTSSVSTACSVITSPRIGVTRNCPATPTPRGGLYVFTGTVKNLGDVTLTNVFVVNDAPSNNTAVIGPITLAPGASANFTGSYLAPICCCQLVETLTARGQDRCSGATVSATASGVCPLLTNPELTLSPICPAAPLIMGSLFTFSGSVSNSGNVTLSNVFVFSDQSPGVSFLGPLELAPGQTENYSGQYIVPFNVCSVARPVSASGTDTCSGKVITNSASSCPVVTVSRIAVTQNCPTGLVVPGGLLNYSGSVSNAGNVTLNNVVVFNDRTGPTPVFTAAALLPGASASYSGSYIAPASCFAMGTSMARGLSLCGVLVSNNVSTICPVLTAPQIRLTAVCSPSGTSPGGLLTYGGTVTNIGNSTVTNVVIVSDLPNPNTVLFTVPGALLPGAGISFSGTYLVPLNACSVTANLTASGRELCSGKALSAATSGICPVLTTPRLVITQNCPVNPVDPNSLLAYSGSISNAGNITLNNLIVSNDQTGTTPILTLATLLPGASVNFNGSYTAPAGGSAISTSTVRATSLCGLQLTNSVSSACPILTTPRIAVTKACPPLPVAPGAMLVFSGTVTNTGNVTLTNVFVVDNQPGANTPVIGPITLNAGAGVSFTGSYVVPANVCSAGDTLTASGNSSATGIAVSSAASVLCPVTTTPRVVITQDCPINPVSPNGLLTYSGSISNAGNITLTNVVVSNDQTGTTPVLTLPTLLPGASANFTGSYTAPASGNATSISTVRASSLCGLAVSSTASSVCPILTTSGIAITKTCPPQPVAPGGTLIFAGTVTNTGNVTLTNIFVVDNQPAANTPVLGPITLSPGAGTSFTGSYVVPPNACSTTDTLTATGNNATTGVTVVGTASAICPISTTPGIVITQLCPLNPVSPNGLLTYTGSISNSGNISLTNLTVSNDQSGIIPILTLPSLLPGASANFTGSFVAPPSGNAISVSTVRASSLCGIAITNSASSTCPILTSSGLALTKACPAQPVTPGGTLVFSGTVTNTGNVTLTNVFVVDNQPAPNTPVIGPITLNPGAGVSFTGSYIVPANACSASDTLTATGNNAVTGVAVIATASAICPVSTTPGIVITQLCPLNPVSPNGLLTYTGSISNSGNISLTNLVVSNDQTGLTPILNLPSLLPGTSAAFTGSFTAPASGNAISVSTVRGSSVCGVAITNSASSTCPILTASGIALTKTCPPTPVSPGGTLVFSGTVTNTGNVSLTNVFVVDNQPAANTPVIGPITLAPGAGTSFTGSYIVPANACSTSDTLIATGNNSANGVVVTGTVSATCAVTTTPGIFVVESCPPGPITLGAPVAFTGAVTNIGNITLSNVFVFGNQPSNNSPILGPITLLPGASVPFAGTFIATGGSNPSTISTIITNTSGSITTNLSTIIITNNAVTIITNASTPSFVSIRSPLATRPGEVVSHFDVGSGLNGLTFYGSASLYGPTLFYSIRHNDATDSIFTIIKTEVAPHTSPPRTEPKDPVGVRNYDSLAFAAPQITGASSVSFYYLRHDATGASYFGYIIPGGVHPDMFTGGSIGRNLGGLTFAAPNAAGKGANLFYYLRQDITGSTFFGDINPDAATPATAATDLFNLGKRIDYMTFSPVDAGYGPANQFYYLRYDNNGNTILGTIDATPGFAGTPAQRAVDRLTLPGRFQELEFTDTDVGYGANLFYSLGVGATFTTNTITTFATNTVATFVTNTVTTFTTNTVTTFTATNTVTAVGIDICQARTVVAAANCLGAVAPAAFSAASGLSSLGIQAHPLVVSANATNGKITISWIASPGNTYVVEATSDLDSGDWTPVQGAVRVNGTIFSIQDQIVTGSRRFYRVVVGSP